MSKRGVVEPFLVGALVDIDYVIIPGLWNDGVNQRRELLRLMFKYRPKALLIREKRLQVGNYVPMEGAEVGRVVRTGLVKVWEVQLMDDSKLDNGFVFKCGEVINILAGDCRHLQLHYEVRLQNEGVLRRGGPHLVHGSTVREVLDKAKRGSANCDAVDEDFHVIRLVPPLGGSYGFTVQGTYRPPV